ncbi:hypothetical protein DFR76_104666 [Nocardia pseudobrasiliensis]|uniref:Uncharacterized protein n=1 Tax=Nocardia pseudobrasiliensis TaxID=45979 RepID=A0A370I849_9NOCA|nr:hypothetical protein DFR76_104666 [Nocardia pseudobrasiliensis]
MAASDRLVRHLFDVCLQLGALRVVFDHRGHNAADARTASAALAGTLDDMDMLVGDAVLAMLLLARHTQAAVLPKPG